MAISLRRRIVQWLPTRWTDALSAQRHRRHWEQDQHVHEGYFAEYRDRAAIIDEVVGVVERNKIAHPRVFEFGCSGGNNLRLLRERLNRPVSFCGVDIQTAGIAWARQHFPDDEFHVSSATTREALPTKAHFDVFLASGVLLYLPPARAQEALVMASQIATHQVFCDVLDAFSSPKGTNDGTFVHPFGAMCAAAGLQVMTPPFLPSPDNRLGVFVTRTTPVP